MRTVQTTTVQSMNELYNRITGDEDARVCKDIPDAACHHQPRNFFAYLVANLLGKTADELASARLVIPWLFGALGVPAAYTGFLVPIREAGILLPQLAVAAAVRHRPRRKGVWLLGAVLCAISLLIMGGTALVLDGHAAGIAIIALLILFSLARGLCSVSAKDVLGKTVSKRRRGALMGWSAGLSGLAVLGVGLWLTSVHLPGSGLTVFSGLLITGGLLWILAALAFAAIREHPGAIGGGGNALAVALGQLRLLAEDAPFRRFVVARGLLLSVALAPPFYVLVAQEQSAGNPLGLGGLIVANGLAASLSAPFWGHLGDRSSRQVMMIASGGAGLLGLFLFAAVAGNWSWVTGAPGMALIFLVLNVMHAGVRLGRKVYLVDLAHAGNRAAYVAVSNTVIGLMMLLGGLAGLAADRLGSPAVILVLALVSLGAAAYVRALPEVSEPA